MNGLLVHCGAAHVERSQLGQVVLPASTDTHQPIAHDYLADLIEDRLEDAGMKIIDAQFALQRDGADMFGLMEVGSARSSDFATVIGFRNSHVRRLSAGLVLGDHVFVCDNLCFSGEVKFGRRHTSNILQDLPDMVTDAIGRVIHIKELQDARAEAYKSAQMSNAQADHVIVDMFRNGCFPKTAIDKVVAEWDKPSHLEFEKTGSSVWRLKQAVTEASKGTGVIAIADRTPKLTPILDSVAKFDATEFKLAA